MKLHKQINKKRNQHVFGVFVLRSCTILFLPSAAVSVRVRANNINDGKKTHTFTVSEDRI